MGQDRISDSITCEHDLRVLMKTISNIGCGTWKLVELAAGFGENWDNGSSPHRFGNGYLGGILHLAL
jgi:hypothetical protein